MPVCRGNLKHPNPKFWNIGCIHWKLFGTSRFQRRQGVARNQKARVIRANFESHGDWFSEHLAIGIFQTAVNRHGVGRAARLGTRDGDFTAAHADIGIFESWRDRDLFFAKIANVERVTKRQIPLVTWAAARFIPAAPTGRQNQRAIRPKIEGLIGGRGSWPFGGRRASLHGDCNSGIFRKRFDRLKGQPVSRFGIFGIVGNHGISLDLFGGRQFDWNGLAVSRDTNGFENGFRVDFLIKGHKQERRQRFGLARGRGAFHRRRRR